MGWGTFIAGQALAWARRNNTEDPEALEKVLWWINNKFLDSYIRRVLSGTVISHPEIWKSVDLDFWEDQITKRAARDWRVLVFIQAVIIVIGFSTFWPLIFAYVPAFWYYGKHQAIKRFRKEINKEFAEEGFDISALLAELPSLLKEEEKKLLKDAEAQRRSVEAEEYKRKFGRSKSPEAHDE